jgi:hypothetical protein
MIYETLTSELEGGEEGTTEAEGNTEAPATPETPEAAETDNDEL